MLMDGQLDIAVVSMLEQKLEKAHFARVDSDVIDRLIVKGEENPEAVSADEQDALSGIFKSQMPKMDKAEFMVSVQALGESATPVMITRSEYMRRMKEMANIQAGMSFYGEMPDMYNIVLNSDHTLVKDILADEERKCTPEVAPIKKEMDDVDARRKELRKQAEGKEMPEADKAEVEQLDKKWDELKAKKEAFFAGYASQNKVVRQLIDLALLQNGMLKGEALDAFVKRSIELIK